MKCIRVLDTGLERARRNIAVTAALAGLRGAAAIPDTLRLYRYRPSVLIGRNQDAGREADLDYCRRNAVEIARRMTGGGAVYTDAGVLTWDMVADRGLLGGRIGDANRLVCEGVARGLGRLGLPARLRSETEIEIAGRKVSGSAGYFEGRTYLCQGTVLIDADFERMAASLRFPGGAGAFEARALLAGRVVNIAEVLGRRPAAGEIEAAVTQGIAESLGVAPTPSRLGPDEADRADELFRRCYGSDAFTFAPEPDAADETAALPPAAGREAAAERIQAPPP